MYRVCKNPVVKVLLGFLYRETLKVSHFKKEGTGYPLEKGTESHLFPPYVLNLAPFQLHFPNWSFVVME